MKYMNEQPEHSSNQHNEAAHQGHHAHMVRDFRKRFWVSLAITIPVLLWTISAKVTGL
ncbi:MAG: hypothetical protein ACOC7U_04865 [Spirochaetota bacterium]